MNLSYLHSTLVKHYKYKVCIYSNEVEFIFHQKETGVFHAISKFMSKYYIHAMLFKIWQFLIIHRLDVRDTGSPKTMDFKIFKPFLDRSFLRIKLDHSKDCTIWNYEPSTLALLDRSVWHFWTVQFDTFGPSTSALRFIARNCPLWVEWLSILIYDRPLWLQRPSISDQTPRKYSLNYSQLYLSSYF